MFANESNSITLAAPTDMDAGQTPVINQFMVMPSIGMSFISFTNTTRQLKINPNSDETYVGSYTIIFGVDDLHGLTNSISFVIQINSAAIPVNQENVPPEEPPANDTIAEETTTDPDPAAPEDAPKP